MFTAQSCSWCHRVVTIDPGAPTVCHRCGHVANAARLDCTCSKCARSLAVSRAELDSVVGLVAGLARSFSKRLARSSAPDFETRAAGKLGCGLLVLLAAVADDLADTPPEGAGRLDRLMTLLTDFAESQQPTTGGR